MVGMSPKIIFIAFSVICILGGAALGIRFVFQEAKFLAGLRSELAEAEGQKARAFVLARAALQGLFLVLAGLVVAYALFHGDGN
jgi:hypothetical protein